MLPASGLRRLSAQARARVDEAATALSRTGLTHSAALLRAFLGKACTLDTAEAAAAAAWLDAHLHILVSGELLAAGSADPAHGRSR
ncbi:hypothetical protein ACH4MM_30300 [Streptomyces pratensis]|uniref:hypothetical protein n=1 Tax=Streptomyces pratensis TaxID=1169025 RepID=UPI0037B01925